jgi:hypothetical protein
MSGKVVADLVAGRTPAFDLRPYAAGRFRWGLAGVPGEFHHRGIETQSGVRK